MRLGFKQDNFDHTYRAFGKGGDPNKEFDHYEPNIHLTFKCSDPITYWQTWVQARDTLMRSAARAYLEGEFLPLDIELDPKPFSARSFSKLAPRVSSKAMAEHSYQSAIDGEVRLLPLQVTRRRLRPGLGGRGRNEQFRAGELHLTLRDTSEPRLLELLYNIGLYGPAIPKLLANSSGGIQTDENGNSVIVRDIPFTIQGARMSEVNKIAVALLELVEAIGGYECGSLKTEIATDFALFNVEPSKDLPPVVDQIYVRPGALTTNTSQLKSLAQVQYPSSMGSALRAVKNAKARNC